MSDGPHRGVSALAAQIVGGGRLRGLDVGARGDLPETWLPLDGVAEFVCVEPDQAACERMRRTYDARGHGELYKILPMALGDSNGPRTLYLTHSRGGSSFFNPDNPTSKAYSDWDYLFPIETTNLTTRHAGEALAEAGVDRVDFAKLDVQGAELEILSVLPPPLLGSMLCLELEAALQRKAPDYPTFPEVHGFMLAQGLELFDVRTLRRHRAWNGKRSGYVVEALGVHAASPSVSGRIYEFDTLYMRPCERVIAAGDPLPLRKLVVCFCLYGFFAEALHAVDAGQAARLFTPDEAKRLADAVKAWHRSARLRWRWRAGRFFDLVRWPLKYFDLEERPAWWPHR
jgi:FkbM family methyltransferase